MVPSCATNGCQWLRRFLLAAGDFPQTYQIYSHDVEKASLLSISASLGFRFHVYSFFGYLASIFGHLCHYDYDYGLSNERSCVNSNQEVKQVSKRYKTKLASCQTLLGLSRTINHFVSFCEKCFFGHSHRQLPRLVSTECASRHLPKPFSLLEARQRTKQNCSILMGSQLELRRK